MKEKISELKACAFTIPTGLPESDGTREWHSSTMILVEAEDAGQKGIGYTYGNAGIAYYILSWLKEFVDELFVDAIGAYAFDRHFTGKPVTSLRCQKSWCRIMAFVNTIIHLTASPMPRMISPGAD